MKKEILSILIICTTLISCTKDEELHPEKFLETKSILGNWNVTTRVIEYENETYIEDLKTEECNYASYDLEAEPNSSHGKSTYGSNCSKETLLGTWDYNEDTNILSTASTNGTFNSVYKISNLSSEEMTFQVLYENGDSLEGTGFKVYLILKR